MASVHDMAGLSDDKQNRYPNYDRQAMRILYERLRRGIKARHFQGMRIRMKRFLNPESFCI